MLIASTILATALLWMRQSSLGIGWSVVTLLAALPYLFFYTGGM